MTWIRLVATGHIGPVCVVGVAFQGRTVVATDVVTEGINPMESCQATFYGPGASGPAAKTVPQTTSPACECILFVEVEEGTSYLLEEPKPVLAFRLLEREASHGRACFCITRQNPDRVRREHRIGRTSCLWLSEIPGASHHSGKALASLAKRIEDFLADPGRRGLVLLDGLEYLVENNGFEAVLVFVEHLNEFVMTRRAVLLIPVSPKTLEARELAMLERDMEVPGVPAWLDEIERGKWAARLNGSG